MGPSRGFVEIKRASGSEADWQQFSWFICKNLVTTVCKRGMPHFNAESKSKHAVSQVSFGCLVGFLPSFELSPKRGLIDFASWAQKNGIDLSQNGGLLRNIVIDASQSSTVQNVENNKPTTAAEGDLNELKSKYKEEISKLMSSFVGEVLDGLFDMVNDNYKRSSLVFSHE